MTDQERTGAEAVIPTEAVIATAQQAVEPKKLDRGDLVAITEPAGSTTRLEDLIVFDDHPRTKKGTYQLATVDALTGFAQRHWDEKRSTVWVHPTRGNVVVVLDDHAGDDEPDAPGWQGFRAKLQLEHTDEWNHWLKLDKQMIDQESFAEHVEEGLSEIRVPDAADMLEIAQSIEATTNASFRSAIRLDSGQTALRYDEDTQAAAGQSGELEIPKEIELAIAPYVGEEPYKITARFRHRIRNNHLLLGYRLERPQAVIQDVLKQIAERLGDSFDTVYLGEPPS